MAIDLEWQVIHFRLFQCHLVKDGYRLQMTFLLDLVSIIL